MVFVFVFCYCKAVAKWLSPKMKCSGFPECLYIFLSDHVAFHLGVALERPKELDNLRSDLVL